MGLESPPGLRPARSGAPRPAPESAPLRAPGDAAAPLSSIMATGAAPTAVKVRLAVCPAPCSLAPARGHGLWACLCTPAAAGRVWGHGPRGQFAPRRGRGEQREHLQTPPPNLWSQLHSPPTPPKNHSFPGRCVRLGLTGGRGAGVPTCGETIPETNTSAPCPRPTWEN